MCKIWKKHFGPIVFHRFHPFLAPATGSAPFVLFSAGLDAIFARGSAGHTLALSVAINDTVGALMEEAPVFDTTQPTQSWPPRRPLKNRQAARKEAPRYQPTHGPMASDQKRRKRGQCTPTPRPTHKHAQKSGPPARIKPSGHHVRRGHHFSLAGSESTHQARALIRRSGAGSGGGGGFRKPTPDQDAHRGGAGRDQDRCRSQLGGSSCYRLMD